MSPVARVPRFNSTKSHMDMTWVTLWSCGSPFLHLSITPYFAPMSFSITFHGAAGTVTGSKHLLELHRSDGSTTRTLLDCGMFQGEALIEDRDRNRHFGFDPASIDLLILSHAHIDHSGLIPRLVKEGFRGPIFCTPATRDLCEIMLMDSAHIQEYDHMYDTERARKRGREPAHEEALYTVEDVRPAMELFQCADYGERLEVAPGMQLLFTDTGHILGSAAVHLRLDDDERELNLSFTGDVGRYVDRLLPEPVRFPEADVIIAESTYGNRDHASVAEAEEELLKHVLSVCVEQRGKLLIPAFSIGRTQELLYTLNGLSNEGRLPRIPVFVDSPLAISATDIMTRHAALFRVEIREELVRDPELFSFAGVEFVRSADRSKELNSYKGPCIIISASGMMEAGRIRHHLRNSLPASENGVLIVGFCAPGTLGADLMEGYEEVRIFGDRVPVRASIRRMEFYSAHADRSEMMQYLSCQDPARVEKLFLVHGSEPARQGFRTLLEGAGYGAVETPRHGARYVF